MNDSRYTVIHLGSNDPFCAEYTIPTYNTHTDSKALAAEARKVGARETWVMRDGQGWVDKIPAELGA